MHDVPLALEAFQRGELIVLRDQQGQTYLAVSEMQATAQSLARMQAAGSNAVTRVTTAEAAPAPDMHLTITVDSAGVLDREEMPDALLDIARMAGDAPRVLACEIEPDTDLDATPAKGAPVVTIDALVLHRRRHESLLDLVAVADLPTPYAPRPFRVHSFTSRFDGMEHLALVTPGNGHEAPLVRMHSECLTGDAFGSLRCDCGPQLDESLTRIAASPGGILLYLRGQEGRGIGLGNKMRAYALQDKGLDTVEANRALGLPDDARDYSHAAEMLRSLGHDRIRLLTNNPDKASGLERLGIIINAIEPLVIPPNAFNKRYLDTKVKKFGHRLIAENTGTQ
ncbi:MAG: GTP cyclohydrolase II [Gammaproteobacteria bacterium]|nr:GTP cyclohydrolase II [Rhizobiaceae bacterium]MBU4115415.1 GTP cyclohydrolase II [Gammaproteobacteria bacterium]